MKRLAIAICFCISCFVSCVNLNPQPQEDYPPTPSLIPPAATSTVSPTSPPVCNLQSEFKPEWETVFCDQFNDNHHNWIIGQEATALSLGNARIEDGKYSIEFTGKAHSQYTSGVIYRIPFAQSYDFVTTVTGTMESLYKDAGWGITFRSTKSGDGYVFLIYKQGWYSVQKHFSGKWVPIISGKTHSAIHWEGENILTVIAEGSKIELFVNGEYIDGFEDSTIRGEYLYLAIWTAEGVQVSYIFDNILIKAPQYQQRSIGMPLPFIIIPAI